MPELKRLGTLLCQPKTAAETVCISAGERVSWNRFYQLIASWQVAIQPLKGNVFALYCEDTLTFSAALLALWQCGKTALIPGDNLPATLAHIEAGVDGFIGDFPIDRQPLKAAVGQPPTREFVAVDAASTSILVCTSGSTGTPAQVPFQLSQLDCELALHEQLWGAEIGTALFVGTASHQHLYGLIFRLLWPLASGRPFSSRTALYLEEVIAASEHWSPVVVITTPSHLSRLPTGIDWDRFAPHCRAVFSSAAPLRRADSLQASTRFGVPVTEIFGSSETSGIAWRRQERTDSWQTLPGIQVRPRHTDGALQLRSPILANPDWLTTADQIELLDGERFRLLGRLDRIVKIEGKRVSVGRLEALLQAHPWLEDARAVELQQRRSELAVVACLTKTGQQQLQEYGKAGLVKALRTTLSDHFERPVLPRRWRFVAALPSNTQGKVTQAMLQGLFVDSPGRGSPPLYPEVLSHRFLDPSRLELVLYISPQIAYFQGHFDRAPILPGVVQIQWAEYFARLHFTSQLPPRQAFSQLEAVKFQQVIQPQQQLTLELSLNNAGKLLFSYYDGEQRFSSGRLVFDSTAPSAP